MPSPETFDKLGIVNMSLTGCMGEDPIGDFDADQTKRAIIMRANYANVKQLCLTRTSWRFATAKVALSKLSGTPTNRWGAAWKLPADNLKVLNTWPPTRYEIQGSTLLSNETSTMEIDYIRLVEEGEFPNWFVNYLAWQLAERTINGIQGKWMDAAGRDSLRESETLALATDSQQQPNQEDLPNPLIDVRS